MEKVAVAIPLLRWAAARARLMDAQLEKAFPKWRQWLNGDDTPTMRQLEDLANKTHTPIGYFFLPTPPQIAMPLPDFRTLRDGDLAEPSVGLLETIFLCQRRQEWYRGYAVAQGAPELSFVGSASLADAPEKVARDIRSQLNRYDDGKRAYDFEASLRKLIAQTEELGVMVMVNSVVGSNTHHPLEVEEFRGFALADQVAPLIFINGADSKAAQMFTLGHELAHIWLGESGISNAPANREPGHAAERWCNQVAAELLVPLEELNAAIHSDDVLDQLYDLAKQFKVSTLVMLRRLFDGGHIDRDTLWRCYQSEVERFRSLKKKGDSGPSPKTLLRVRNGKRFAQAVLASTLEGQTLFLEAFRLLGVKSVETLNQTARELGVSV